jgi:hypothetical protein
MFDEFGMWSLQGSSVKSQYQSKIPCKIIVLLVESCCILLELVLHTGRVSFITF